MSNTLFLLPEAAFHVSLDVHVWQQKFTLQHMLPNLKVIFGIEGQEKERKESLFFAWSQEGLHIRHPLGEASSLNPHLGEIELFIDTKNVKNVKATHRHIHHFCFFSERIDGVFGKEVTRFRTEDRHQLCDPALLEVIHTKIKSKTYLDITIPAACLVGYVGEEGTSIGFNYRLPKEKGVQFFMESEEPMQAPYVWPTLHFVGKAT